MSPQACIIASLILVFTGFAMVTTKKNVIAMLLGIELIFNAANLNLVVFNQFWMAKGIGGQMMTLFILAIVVAEMALALAIVLRAVKEFRTSNIDEFNNLGE